MLIDILKDDAWKRLKREIKKSGYSIDQLASRAHLEKYEVQRVMDGDINEMDFLMLVNLCKAINIDPFSFFKDDIKLADFLNSIY